MNLFLLTLPFINLLFAFMFFYFYGRDRLKLDLGLATLNAVAFLAQLYLNFF